MADNIIEIHTSDRGTYKRCRRRFGWGSTLRDNLVRIGPDQKAFFTGTGVHFALEDYWGYRRFAHPALAFAAYYDAQKKEDLPDEADEALELATGMLMYYADDWLHEHPEPFVTLVVDGKPQVEVEIAVDLTDLLFAAAYPDNDWLHQALASYGADAVHYVITLDRAVIDRHDRIYGLDYKTAATFDELNLQTNPQAGSYDWAGSLFYANTGYTFDGMIWQQHRKLVPVPPKWVNEGKKNAGFSMAVDQATTYRLYRRAVFEKYGSVPSKYHDFLGMLGNMQDDFGDRFVRRDTLRRNQYQREVEQGKIIAEVLEMLDPELPLYPNPTKECSWDCAFKVPCLAMDDGSDFQSILNTEYMPWAGYRDDWRSRVKYPDAGAAPEPITFAFTP